MYCVYAIKQTGVTESDYYQRLQFQNFMFEFPLRIELTKCANPGAFILQR